MVKVQYFDIIPFIGKNASFLDRRGDPRGRPR